MGNKKFREYIEERYGMPDDTELWGDYLNDIEQIIDQNINDIQNTYFSQKQLDEMRD